MPTKLMYVGREQIYFSLRTMKYFQSCMTEIANDRKFDFSQLGPEAEADMSDAYQEFHLGEDDDSPANPIFQKHVGFWTVIMAIIAMPAMHKTNDHNGDFGVEAILPIHFQDDPAFELADGDERQVHVLWRGDDVDNLRKMQAIREACLLGEERVPTEALGARSQSNQGVDALFKNAIEIVDEIGRPNLLDDSVRMRTELLETGTAQHLASILANVVGA
ncbi:hypothetical protein LTR17_001009 [Elasticomyces elasticus]|nr:hypothetical protein LTR17_001009 [Elasticomyces elasticus]